MRPAGSSLSPLCRTSRPVSHGGTNLREKSELLCWPAVPGSNRGMIDKKCHFAGNNLRKYGGTPDLNRGHHGLHILTDRVAPRYCRMHQSHRNAWSAGLSWDGRIRGRAPRDTACRLPGDNRLQIRAGHSALDCGTGGFEAPHPAERNRHGLRAWVTPSSRSTPGHTSGPDPKGSRWEVCS